nr:tRNA (adenosine(37)-N6)-threonylcarbamoyltransferase complex ATPase subunit type 1 TsaE [Solemya velesiana gill symbiont]
MEANTPDQQEALGGILADACPERCVIYLEGNLGAGKTTLVRGFLRSMGYEGAVKSPTYTLLEPYDLGSRSCYHFDLYRLSDPGELEYLGIRDLLEENAILLIEWPEKGVGELPPADLWVHIHYQGEGRRLELVSETPSGSKVIEEIDRRLQA